MNVKKELEKVQIENRTLFQTHQDLLQQVDQLAQQIQQNNGVILFLKEKIVEAEKIKPTIKEAPVTKKVVNKK